MKAAIVEGPNRLVVREIPDPDIGDYDLLCELLYGATCTATDRHIIEDNFPFPVTYPLILGHESIGRVIRGGAKVRNFTPGDLVTRVGAPATEGLSVAWGGFAELGVARDHEAMQADDLPPSVWKPYRVNQRLPPDCDPRAATMMITWRETYSYVKRMGIDAGVRVLVIGTGGNGLAFCVHVCNRGAAHVAVVGSAARLKAARQAGAQTTFDYRSTDLEQGLADDGGRYDFIIDAVGTRESLSPALPALAPGGALGVYGIEERGALRIDPTQVSGSFTVYQGHYEEAEVHQEVTGMFLDGRLDASLWMDLDQAYPLEDIGAAYEMLKQRKAIKALIKLQI